MPTPEFINTLLWEIALEASRLALPQPPQPSRLNCVFAYATELEAARFRDTFRVRGHIYEVAPIGDNPPLMRDATRLTGEITDQPYAIGYSEAAKHYWQRTDNAEDPELLYDCPLRVIRRV